jgi:hypothetical protein
VNKEKLNWGKKCPDVRAPIFFLLASWNFIFRGIDEKIPEKNTEKRKFKSLGVKRSSA